MCGGRFVIQNKLLFLFAVNLYSRWGTAFTFLWYSLRCYWNSAALITKFVITKMSCFLEVAWFQSNNWRKVTTITHEYSDLQATNTARKSGVRRTPRAGPPAADSCWPPSTLSPPLQSCGISMSWSWRRGWLRTTKGAGKGLWERRQTPTRMPGVAKWQTHNQKVQPSSQDLCTPSLTFNRSLPFPFLG